MRSRIIPRSNTAITEASGRHRTRRVQILLVDEISKTVERNVGFRNDRTVEHRLIEGIPVPT
jgi:hypothetical protein